jgi:hypothetical protein
VNPIYVYIGSIPFANPSVKYWCNAKLLHRKKRFTSFPSPAGMSLTKLLLGSNNSVMTSLFAPRESLVVTSRLGTGNSRTFFYGVWGEVFTNDPLDVKVLSIEDNVEEGCGTDGHNVEIPAPHRLIRLNKPGKRTLSRGCNWLKGLKLKYTVKTG